MPKAAYQEAARDADHAERQDDGHLVRRHMLHEAEVKNNDHRHEGFENAEKSSLCGEVGLQVS